MNNLDINNLYFVAWISTFIQLLTLVMQFVKYGYKSLLHPGFWFVTVWIGSFLSFILYLNIGFTFIIFNPEDVIELMVYVDFTSICLLFFGWFKSAKIKDHQMNFKFVIEEKLLKYLSIILFSVVLINWYKSGSDIVSNRAAGSAEMLKNQKMVSQIGVATLLFNIAKSANLVLLTYTSFKITKAIVDKSFEKIKFYYYLPTLTMILGTVVSGGRAGVIYALIYFSTGLFIALSTMKNGQLYLLKRMSGFMAIALVGFSLYSTLINQLRAESTDYDPSFEKWKDYPALVPISGIVQYLTDHYPGYQLRKEDSVTPELELGEKTFSFILFFNIPFISQLYNAPIGLASYYGFKLPEAVELGARGLEWENTTATIFLNVYDDFGYYGTFIAIFVFCFLTEFVFTRFVLADNDNYLISMFPFAIFLYLWTQSIFSHHTVGSWMGTLFYQYLILDILNYLFTPRILTTKIE
jgi:oligosaccharide repeat unit polymerase